MRTYKRLKQIEKKSFLMGNEEYKIFMKTKSIEALKTAIKAYRATMESIRYQILYNNLWK